MSWAQLNLLATSNKSVVKMRDLKREKRKHWECHLCFVKSTRYVWYAFLERVHDHSVRRSKYQSICLCQDRDAWFNLPSLLPKKAAHRRDWAPVVWGHQGESAFYLACHISCFHSPAWKSGLRVLTPKHTKSFSVFWRENIYYSRPHFLGAHWLLTGHSMWILAGKVGWE